MFSNDFMINLVCWIIALGICGFVIYATLCIITIKNEVRAQRKLMQADLLRNGMDEKIIKKIAKDCNLDTNIVGSVVKDIGGNF